MSGLELWRNPDLALVRLIEEQRSARLLSRAYNPKTLIRAARDFEQSESMFALKAALTALRWLCAGHGYDLVGNEAYQAFDHALRAADRVGQQEEAREAMRSLVGPEGGPANWAGEALRRLLASTDRASSTKSKE